MGELGWPFRAAEALGAGAISVRELRRLYSSVYPGVYAPRALELSASQRACAAWLWSRRQGAVAGMSAAALLGAKWIEPDLPAELVHTNRRAPSLLTVHSDELLAGETQTVAEMTVTTPERTAFDIGRRSALSAGVRRIDALMQATDVKVVDIETVIARHPRVRGLAQLRRTLRLVDGGAESPYESLTRLLLVRAGFPLPQTQLPVADRYGFVVGRIDMGWREYLVGVEFDGAQHWTDARQRTRDIDRLAKLQDLGWTIVRVTSGMVHRTPGAVIERVGAALQARGCDRTW
jgi:hypothetical protein